ncbi:hypothetical protein MY04_2594 [Flammeovirga sp. MY04]|uniref:hypothetical protein n=1 Tax=Flammeovirga sp. MY04 TaxID=1191459 RepID=UPI0008061131|nr:hypothetical protein [Flammeovirga sp. MY04]ANQ49963.1 hypothetical protein MY04_2594 [Flammeovirga sp. MY04]
MKKYLVVLFAVMFSLTAFAQEKKGGKQAAKATKYAELAQTEFNLNDEAKNKVFELKLAHQKEASKLAKQKKSGELAVEDFKEKQKALNKSYAPKFAEAMGVSKKEYAAFNKKVKEEMKKK